MPWSLEVKEIAFVGYPVTDFGKARAFYGGLLGLEEAMVFEEAGDVHWIEYSIGEGTLALARAGEHWQPNKDGGGVCLEVKDLDSAVEHLRANGVEPVLDIGDYPACRMAVVADPDGNGIALHQRKENHPDYKA